MCLVIACVFRLRALVPSEMNRVGSVLISIRLMFRSHITHHDLERYYLGMIQAEDELARIEEHLLACAECVVRAEQAEEFVDILRAALLQTEESHYLLAGE